MIPANLADREWESAVWGNYQTNIEFLRRVGLLDDPKTILEVGCGKGKLLKASHSPAPLVTARPVAPPTIQPKVTPIPQTIVDLNPPKAH